MFIHWSDEAIAEMKSRFGPETRLWKLVSDSEDCGCSVNGVPTFWAVSAPESGELKAESNAFEVWYVPQHAVFFDEQLRVSYHSKNHSFQLASDGQIYTNRLKLTDKRSTSAAL
ncbi:iron-sulfur cluster biosynthesis family protein [Cohnella sp.]|uniref:iron-sulfur cluster biosynthesis family protein n=1 Tax=Cohnella sp. TaxID=1883426 RepID=UPI0035627039